MKMAAQIFTQPYHSPCGEMVLGDYAGKLCLCDWANGKHRRRNDQRIQHFFNARYVCGSTPLLQATAKELDAWFAGALVQFNLPLAMAGTPFQQRVWNALLATPYGQTTSYTDVARAAGCSNGVRAVAQAIGANSICIIVPCHRIIGLDGTLTGFAAGVSTKRFLLRIEGVDV